MKGKIIVHTLILVSFISFSTDHFSLFRSSIQPCTQENAFSADSPSPRAFEKTGNQDEKKIQKKPWLGIFLAAVIAGGVLAYLLLRAKKEKKTNPVFNFISKWGSCGKGRGQFLYPHGIAIDEAGNVYVACNLNDRVQKFTKNGDFVSSWGSHGPGNGQFYCPMDLTIDQEGFIYVADQENYRVQKFSSNGAFIKKWGSKGTKDGQFWQLTGIAADHQGNIYITESNCRVQKFTSQGKFVCKWGIPGYGDGQFFLPEAIAVDHSGYVYVADYWNHRIQKFTSDGTFVKKWGSIGEVSGPTGLGLDSAGNIYITEYSGFINRVQKFTPEGISLGKWGSEGMEDGQFDFPQAIAFDTQDNAYVVDVLNCRIQKFRTK